MQFLLALAILMFCVATLQSATADPAMSFQPKPAEGSHAAVTDMPDIIDMSHADPRTWHSLPAAGQVNNPEREELDQPIGFSVGAATATIGSMPLVK